MSCARPDREALVGIWTSFKAALGLSPPPRVRDPGVLQLARAGQWRLRQLPAGEALHLTLRPVPEGFLVVADERRAEGPLVAIDGGEVVAGADVLARARGLVLDHDGDRWVVRASVRVVAEETPNPDGRMFRVDRPLSAGRVFAEGARPHLPRLITQLVGRDDVASVLVRGATLTVARVPGRPWPPIDAAVGQAVREHVVFCGGVISADATAAEAGDDLRAAVWEVLEASVLPALHKDGGDLELVDISDGVVTVHLVGACKGCPASALTLEHGIARTLRDAFPGEISEVRAL
jgi:Fe-S cluster biogenesis protein NfuA